MSKKLVGIMGGTFNPIHMGHLLLAEYAYNEFGLDEVVFIPTGISYLKDSSIVADKSLRYEMTRDAIADNPHFSLSDIEVNKEGNSYTYETLLALKEQNPQVIYHLIIGADSLLQIESWKNSDIIFKEAVIIAAMRGDSDNEVIGHKASELMDKYKANIKIMNFPSVDISSTDIRDRVKKGLGIRYLVTDSTVDYIKEHNLYKD